METINIITAANGFGQGGAYNDKVNRVQAYLSLFSTSQLEEIVSVVMAKGRSIIPSPHERATQQLPPALLQFLQAGPGYAYNADQVNKLLWGFSTMVYANFRRPGRDKVYYKNLLKDAFGLSDDYADMIATKVETPDKIKGFGNKSIEFLRNLVNNWFLPGTSFDIPEASKFDTDQAYEMMLLGGQLQELAIREQMKVGSLAHYIGAGLVFSLATEGSGDFEGDVQDSERLLKLMEHASQPYGDIEEGGPFGLMLKLSRRALKAIPPDQLQKAANKAVKIKVKPRNERPVKLNARAKPEPTKQAFSDDQTDYEEEEEDDDEV